MEDEKESSCDLDWLAGRQWTDLTDYEKNAIIRSQQEREDDPYLPARFVSRVIGLLHEYDVIDAGSVDTEVIINQFGIENAKNPYKITEALERVAKRKLSECPENESDTPGAITIDDLTYELEQIAKEEQFKKQLELDIHFLTLIGVDPRQIEQMASGDKEKQEDLMTLAHDLRSPIAKDLAQSYIKRNQAKRPIMRSYEDVLISIEARKYRETKQNTRLENGESRIIIKLANMFIELRDSEEGRFKILELQHKAFDTIEGKELMEAIMRVESELVKQRALAEINLIFDLDNLRWEEPN